MSKVRISQAAKMVGKSRYTLYRDIEAGLLSCEIDERGFKVIDVSELERCYGKLKAPDDEAAAADETQVLFQSDNMKQHETTDLGDVPAEQVIELLKDQVETLTAQLEQSTEQVKQGAERESQLLQLLSTEQEKTKLLMLPAPKPKLFGWLSSL